MLDTLEREDNVINRASFEANNPNNKEEYWSGVPRWLSSYDLHKALGLRHDEIVDNDVLLCYLHEYGIDVTYRAVIEQLILHRPLSSPTQQAILAPRWVGMERTDREWLESGNASQEVRLNASGFTDLKDEVERMSKQSNFTADIIEHIQEKKNVSGRKDGKTSALGGHA